MATISMTSFVCIYYNVVIAYCVIYFVSSFLPNLPWVGCDHSWNDEFCLASNPTKVTSLTQSDLTNLTNLTQSNFTNLTSLMQSDLTTVTSFTQSNLSMQKPSHQYFYKNVLQISSGIDDIGGMNWKLVGSLFFCYILTFVILSKGIQSLGKVSYVTAIFPYIMIIILIIRGVTLPGAMKGIKFYIWNIDFEKLFNIKTWIDASSQVLFCLSLAHGGIITLGKHNKFHYNHLRTSYFIVILDGFTGILAGFAIFSVLGFMSEELGVEVKELAVGGPGLSFIVYPEALSLMPFPWIWCILFFAMMITIGYGSQLSLAESVLDSFIFFIGIKSLKKRILFRFFCCMGFACIGCLMATNSGYYFLVIIESYTTTVPIIVLSTLEAIIFGWIYGFQRLSDDIHLMLNIRLSIFWKICITYVTPVLAIVIF
jgi:SNF family Na+-dependent transporter